MIEVYHLREFEVCIGADAEFPQDYDMVAEVQADDLEEGFRLTNTIDSPWWEQDGVQLFVKPPLRSTSAGDVLVLEGVAWRCRMAGWARIQGKGGTRE